MKSDDFCCAINYNVTNNLHFYLIDLQQKMRDHDDLTSCKKVFSERLSAVADARGYPKTNYGRNTELARDLKITISYAHKLLHGHIVSVALLRQIAVELNTTTDYLLGLSDVMDRVPPKKKRSSPE